MEIIKFLMFLVSSYSHLNLVHLPQIHHKEKKLGVMPLNLAFLAFCLDGCNFISPSNTMPKTLNKALNIENPVH